MRVVRLVMWLSLAMLESIGRGRPAPAAEPTAAAAELVTVGSAPVIARLAGLSQSGELDFRMSDGRTLLLDIAALVRWSTPAPARGPEEVHLREGSRLRLAAAWGKEPAWSIGPREVRLTLHQLGQWTADRRLVEGIYLRLPPDDAARQRLVDAARAQQAANPSQDVVMLDNGDMLAGRLRAVSGAGEVQIEAGVEELKVPPARVAAILLSEQSEAAQAESTVPVRAFVGFRNGSRLAVQRIAGQGHEAALQCSALGEVRVPLGEIVFLQGLADSITYLSDLEAAAYEQTPYLEVKWPWRQDRNVLGDPLRSNGRSYLKGLGVHSGSRLTFSLDGRRDRFAATVALDDAAHGAGSAMCRVLLKAHDREFREVFACEVNGIGNEPLAMEVGVAGASALALVVDYGQRGDERDYVNWLDARLEQAGGGVESSPLNIAH
jgi:hypothetical protein